MPDSIANQLRRNAVALISLTVALASLGYNTWRNEATEANRNQRTAAFQLLLQAGELQELVFLAHYDRDAMRGNPRRGWALVLTIRDLSEVLPGDSRRAAAELHERWQAHWSRLGDEQASADTVIAGIDAVRTQTQALLRSLD